MSSFVNMRSTIVKIKASVRAKLSPKPLEYINFDLKDFLSYTKKKKINNFFVMTIKTTGLKSDY